MIISSAISRVFWLKNTKIDSYQFMDLNTHQYTKMQTWLCQILTIKLKEC
ncbi:pyrazinamidase/nicotinamidase [Helicobacter pylori]|nr:pyrazinamidase/nicotinamidase [Helicobacter pylori]